MKEIIFLEELISIKSYDINDNKEIINYLENQFSLVAKEIIKIKNKEDDRENLLIGLNTKLKNINNAIVLAGHIDTVPADEISYKTNPYTATRIDRNIYGLGTIDMKSFFAVILNNLEKLVEIKLPVIIAITSDEETIFNSIKEISNLMKSLKITPKLTIVGEPTNSKICTESKSCLEYQVEIFGKSCHSSCVKLGINANYIGARIALYIEKLCNKFKDTSTSSNIISGGEKVNIISNYCTLNFDIRTKNKKNSEKIIKLIKNFTIKLEKKYYGAKIIIKNKLSILPLEDKKSKMINNILSDLNIQKSSFTGGCEAGYYQEIGGDSIIFGVGDLALAHKPNEFVNIDEFVKYNQNLIKIIKFIENNKVY